MNNVLDPTEPCEPAPCPPGSRANSDWDPTGVSDNNCVQNVCTCANGVAAESAACTTHEAEKCVSCNDGYIRVDDLCVVESSVCGMVGRCQGGHITSLDENGLLESDCQNEANLSELRKYYSYISYELDGQIFGTCYIYERCNNTDGDAGYLSYHRDCPVVRDACGVPNGDGSTCLDACGVPNGDGSTCRDACGVGNGNNSIMLCRKSM